MISRSIHRTLAAMAFLCFTTQATALVSIDWVTVHRPDNGCDPHQGQCFGSVDTLFQISKFEVTNDQYAEFLNAVATTDTNGLYSVGMGSGTGGVTRSGSPGSYSYTAIAGREDMPVNFVIFWNAIRFANWLHNDQPVGGQDDTTTEDGAYTLTPAGIADNTVTRNSGALVSLTSEDEWFKAAYYHPSSMIYLDYPAGTDTATSCAAPGATANTANCNNAVEDFTDVGAYTNSASPNGTFDQGGNVFEWNETIAGLTNRGVRGGVYSFGGNFLHASNRFGWDPTREFSVVGFRVSSPSPPPDPVPALGPFGIATLLALLGATAYWRLRDSTFAVSTK